MDEREIRTRFRDAVSDLDDHERRITELEDRVRALHSAPGAAAERDRKALEEQQKLVLWWQQKVADQAEAIVIYQEKLRELDRKCTIYARAMAAVKDDDTRVYATAIEYALSEDNYCEIDHDLFSPQKPGGS